MLVIKNVRKTFNKGTVNEKKALRGISLTLNDGDFVTIIGGNGAGKSTLLNMIAGAYPVDSGIIEIDGENITKQPECKRAKYIGRVFQDPMKGTAADMQIEENMALAFRRGERRRLRWAVTQKEREFYKDALERLGLGLQSRMTSKVGLLSGGQRQALTLLMATLKRPHLLLLDEHTAALDPKTASKVLALTEEIVSENHLTALMVTHNMNDAIRIGNRLIMMDNGKIIYDVAGEENGWYKIKSGTVTGYVRKDLIATGDTAQNLAVQHAQVMAIVNTESLNVRSEASTDSKAWTAVTSGQRYNVLNQLDGWVQLELDAGDDDGEDQGAFVSTRDNNVTVQYALQEAIEYYPAVEAANAAMAFRNKIVNFACQFVGNRYVWGGTSLTHGCDCSGFTQSVLKNFGISIPRVSRDQARTGSKVTSANMRPGDLIFYANRSGTINHVGMYIGNGQVVNAASTRSGIRIYRWNYRTPVAIRNVIGD